MIHIFFSGINHNDATKNVATKTVISEEYWDDKKYVENALQESLNRFNGACLKLGTPHVRLTEIAIFERP